MISPTSVSYEEIRKDLEEYIQQLSESDSAWKDFFETSTGQVLLELLAGFGAFVLYKAYVGRREAYLPEVTLLTSAISIAEGLGYSVYRGTPPRLTLTVSSGVPFSLPKYSIIGSCKDYDVILAEDVILNGGDTATVTAYIGKIVQEQQTLTVPPDKKYLFVRFTKPVAENTFELLVNGNPVPYSTQIKDLSDGWVLLTNKHLSIDAYNLNSTGIYKTGDVIELKGISWDNVIEPSLSDVNLTYPQFSIVSLEPATPPADVDTIRVVAPYYADTSMIVRAREDYKKLLLLKFPYLRDAITHDDPTNPGTVYVSYLKKDLTLLTDNERQDFLNYLDQLRPMGIPLPTIVDPVQISTTLTVSVKLAYPVQNTLVIQAIWDAIEKNSKWLGKDLDFYAIEHAIEENDFITVARVTNNNTYTVDWNSYVVVSDITVNYI